MCYGILRRLALMGGLACLLGGMTSCIPFVFVLPVPYTKVVNRPYESKIVSRKTEQPIENVRVEVETFRVSKDGEEPIRKYTLKSDENGRIYIPRHTEFGILVVLGAGIIFPFPEGVIAVGGVIGPHPTKLVLRLKKEGYADEHVVFLEVKRKTLGKIRAALPDTIRMASLE